MHVSRSRFHHASQLHICVLGIIRRYSTFQTLNALHMQHSGGSRDKLGESGLCTLHCMSHSTAVTTAWFQLNI